MACVQFFSTFQGLFYLSPLNSSTFQACGNSVSGFQLLAFIYKQSKKKADTDQLASEKTWIYTFFQNRIYQS